MTPRKDRTARTVAPRDLQAMLHDGEEIALLDVREAGQFGESHLFFAVPLPYSRLELDLPRLVPRRTTRVVLCDDGASGVASLAARRLAAAGYSDVAVLEGGTRAWAEAGYPLFEGVNVPSKAFGELVEHVCRTPRISPRELARMQAEGADVVVVDGRPFSEFQRMNIPGAVCCPNAELALRIGEIVQRPETTIVVNCAGRTRSIIGAQTLIHLGVPNPVYALENGTQGWFLAGLELERGSRRRYPERVDEGRLPELRRRAHALARRFGVEFASAAALRAWLADPSRTTYVLDVRTPEEFEAGSLPGAVHAPGGQLVQATDQWLAVRNARVVLLDSESVRAPVVASWLRQLGWNAWVLEEGVHAGFEVPQPERPRLPQLSSVPASELARELAAGRCAVLDLRPSMSFRVEHIPGSRWSTRVRIVADARQAAGALVLVADEPAIARLASIDLVEAGLAAPRLLEGGLAGWRRAGLALETSPGEPPDAQCIDYLFFVHDRHAGNAEAARRYLEWEKGLLARLDERDRATFRIGL
jgi:rhodanese-related sulfurtransferase